MNKKLMYIMLCFAMVLIPCFNVSAEEVYPDLEDDPDFVEYLPDRSGEENVKNDKGQVIEGYFRIRYRRWVADDEAYNVCYSYDTLTDESNYLYILFLESENDDEYNYYRLCGSDSVEVCRTYYYESANANREFGTSVSDPLSVSFKSSQYKNGYPLADYKRIDSKAVVVESNIPIFNADDEEAINAYVENGDYSGAINSDDIKGMEYDKTIELPHDLKFSGEIFFHKPLSGGYCFKTKNACGVSWQIPDDDTLLYDLDVCGTFNTTSGQKTTQWHSLARHSAYSGDAVIFDFINENLNVNLLDNSIASYVNSSGWDVDEMVLLSVRVRHVKDGKYSNWVVLSMDKSGSGSAHVEDVDGNVVDDDEYTGSDGYDTNGENGGSVADDKNTVVDTSNISINGIMGYIKSGFGLLGSGGIIALMSQTYLYLPGSVWTIIKFFISMLVAICLIKLVKEVLL